MRTSWWTRGASHTLCACVGSLFLTGQALAWGEKGHQLVADVAAAGLTQNARQQVAQILGGRSMAQIALWADDMRTWQRNPRKPPPARIANDPEARDFFLNPKNKGQPDWHFVNLPLGVPRYQLGQTGTNREDVVQIIKRCTAVLAGKAAANEHLTRGQALRLLVHFVGDLHQGLHASCGYYLRSSNGAARPANLAQAAQGVHDRGGNSLEVGRNDSFHSFWDTPMVRSAQGQRSDAQYVRHLVSLVGAGPWRLNGDPRTWPEGWATEVAGVAALAYRPIDRSRVRFVSQNEVKGTVTIPASYAASFRTAVDQQLARGGFRLGAILNTLRP